MAAERICASASTSTPMATGETASKDETLRKALALVPSGESDLERATILLQRVGWLRGAVYPLLGQRVRGAPGAHQPEQVVGRIGDLAGEILRLAAAAVGEPERVRVRGSVSPGAPQRRRDGEEAPRWTPVPLG